VTSRDKPRRAPTPLNSSSVQDLALRYVGKYATTRAKLAAYLARKLRERGWDGQREPDVQALTDRLAELGYVDDAAFALSKSRALGNRGYGRRRLSEQLRHAGVGDNDSRKALEAAEANAVVSALRFAERRRIGPFASAAPDPRQREKWIGAMVRAGHPFGLARAIAEVRPGAEIDIEALGARASGAIA